MTARKPAKRYGVSRSEMKAMRRKAIVLFGSSAPRAGEPLYELARDIGRALAVAGFDLIHGGHEGVMEAASRGARDHGAHVTGVTCRAVREARGAVINPFLDEVIDSETIFERIAAMMRRASGFVIMEGGTGTLAEFGLVWEYANKRFFASRPIICVGQFWRPVVDAVSLAQPTAADSLTLVETADEVARVMSQGAIDLSGPDEGTRCDDGRDTYTTVAQLKRLMHDFVAARNWHQFHDAKNLSASIAIEAAELMEHFQWVHSDAVRKIRDDTKQMAEIREEVADVLAYLLSFASTMNIDMADALTSKMVKNAAKYPVKRFYGTFKPKDLGADPTGTE